jgi:outer membrane protein assembly factor BamB
MHRARLERPPAVALRVALISAALIATCVKADIPMHPALSVERFENGNTLIAVGSSSGLADGLVIEVDSLHRLVWAYVRNDIPWVHTARRQPNGNTLVSATFGDRVLEFDALGNPVWEYATGLAYPNEAFRLADGHTLITDRDNNRVIEVDSGGSVVWSYTDLHGPHHGNRLENGNTLICDSDSNRVIEVNLAGQLVWRYPGSLFWPRAAQRLPNGNTLITDSNNRLVIEVDSAGTILWRYNTAPRGPYMAVRLANGNTLISSEDIVREITPEGT